MTSGLKTFDHGSIDGFARTFEELFNRGDFVGMADFYADDATLIAEGTPMVEGRHSLEQFWEIASKRSGVKERTIEVRRIESSDNLGYVLGSVAIKVQGAAPASLITLRINYTTVWRREFSGQWRLIVDISSRESMS